MRIAIFNLHRLCEHNTLFLSRAERYFVLNGHQVSDGAQDPGQPDMVLVGGCAVTDAMRGRCEGAVSSITQRWPGARIVVFGCLAAFPEGMPATGASRAPIALIPFKASRRLDALIGAECPFETVRINRLAGHVPYQPCMGPDDCYVLIAQGCVNDCSYCNIKKAKGAVISRPVGDIEDEVGRLYRQGIRTVTLLADDCGSFGLDLQADLPLLLDRLCRAAPAMCFKIYTMFPALFLRQLPSLEPFFAQGRIAYLCLPVQSASPRVLDLMNRRYDPGRLAQAIRRLRALDPHVFVYTHFIYNFPTESWADFERSIAFASCFDHCVFIGYGENRGTRAASIFPKCDERTLQDKTRHLEDLVQNGRLAAFVVPHT